MKKSKKKTENIIQNEGKPTCLFDTDTAIHEQSHGQANYTRADYVRLYRENMSQPHGMNN